MHYLGKSAVLLPRGLFAVFFSLEKNAINKDLLRNQSEWEKESTQL